MMSPARPALPPLLAIALFTGVACALLAFPLRLPLGANYWDITIYVDAAHRMANGQWPHLDFHLTVGALNKLAYLAAMTAFPSAHPLLAAQYGLVFVMLPLLVAISLAISKDSGRLALAIVVPFLVLALFPVNGTSLYPQPGFDGYGVYNRQTALLLYMLAATVMLIGDRTVASLLALLLLALLAATKITGFVVGGIIVAHGVVAGRLALRPLLAACGVALILIVAADLATGVPRAYASEILLLVSYNQGTLLPRVLTALSLHFDVAGPVLLLLLALGWRERDELARDVREIFRDRSKAALSRLADRDAAWIVTLFAMGTVYETQNTGSYEYILLWPALLRLILGLGSPLLRRDMPLFVIAAMAALPTPLSIAHHGLRASISAFVYRPVDAELLGPLGRVSVKPDIARHAAAMAALQPALRASQEELARSGLLPSYILFSEIDYQVNWLRAANEAARALLAHEAAIGRRYGVIASLDFVDPLPAALGRQSVRDLPVAHDPTRTPGRANPATIAELNKADAILLPQCPVTWARQTIARSYAPALEGRRKVMLTPCYEMYLKD
jgi:hypothetical protein